MSSSEQSVSGRVNSPVAAQASKRDAETRENQVRQGSSDAASRGLDRYVPSSRFDAEWLILCSADISTSKGQGEPVEPVDEAAQLEARRKRREAIRAKYRGQATPLRLQALQLGAETESSTPSADTGTTNNTASGE